MFWVKLRRVIKGGLLNFKRNGLVSYAAILVTTIVLSVITGIFLFHVVLGTSITLLKNKVDIAVYFTIDAPEERILELQSTLKNLPEVATVVYTSADQQVLEFRNRHADDYLTLQALDELGDNPFGGLVLIKAKDSSQYEAIAKVLEGDNQVARENSEIIERINYSQNKVVIDRLNSFINSVEKIGVIVILLLSLISAIIMFTTIRLTIYVAREEIGIMRLVGASRRYVEAPFLVEGALYGIFAWLISVLIFIPITYLLGKHASDLIGMNLYSYYLGHFFSLNGLVLLIGVLLGIISSMFAVRKYLNV